MTAILFLVQLKKDKKILKSFLGSQCKLSVGLERQSKNAEVLQVEDESDDPKATLPVMAIWVCGHAARAGHAPSHTGHSGSG